MLPTALERYRPIIDDWNAFLEYLSRPQPATLRVNRLKADPAWVRARLAERGFHLEPYDWYPDLLRVERGPHSPGQTLEHWLGYFYLQEAAAAVPVLALDPQPGERVLDLSAAPGGKTTQMAERMGDEGLIVANDADARRLGALQHNVSRLGITAVAVTRVDGRRFPLGVPFDRVLVDAPCTAEGNARRSGRARRGAKLHQIRRLASIQVSLLRRGLTLVREGGVVVYSTCTFAPEENEAVVDEVVRAAGGAVVVEPLPPGLPGAPGVTAWEGRRFVPEVELCRRIYPHHLDSGGMFVARLRRVGPLPWAADGPAGEGSDAGPGWTEADPDLRARVVDWFRTRYGVDPAAFEGFHAFALGSERGIWLARVPRVPGWPELRSVGIRAVRAHGVTWKPTSFGLTRFAATARRNVVDLDREELRALLEGRRVAPPANLPEPLERGWVALRYDGAVIGCGLLLEDRVTSALPQERAEELLSCLRRESEGGRSP
ncbi:MAG: RNA methyltransferase [Bacillota bacterium]|nr:MAG: RNA methyltransferase [Bacillota bacterium]